MLILLPDAGSFQQFEDSLGADVETNSILFVGRVLNPAG